VLNLQTSAPHPGADSCSSAWGKVDPDGLKRCRFAETHRTSPLLRRARSLEAEAERHEEAPGEP
jgi:hypothetical protein